MKDEIHHKETPKINVGLAIATAISSFGFVIVLIVLLVKVVGKRCKRGKAEAQVENPETEMQNLHNTRIGKQPRAFPHA